jgi:hypothetical protein
MFKGRQHGTPSTDREERIDDDIDNDDMNPHQTNGNIPLVNGLPSSGQQTDMTYLWNVVQQLSDALAENRAQTAGIINGVQQIQVSSAQHFRFTIRILDIHR